MSRFKSPRAGKALLFSLFVSGSLLAATPNLKTNIDRPLRYTPDAGDFVIKNGPDSFNRSMYGGNTAFRADGGDRPEFSLFLPGRGGALRLGLRNSTGTKWLRDAENIEARYRPGMMVYEIHDHAFGNAVIHVSGVAAAATESLLVKVQVDGASEPMELILGFGGADGNKGSRNGDIGTERQPVSEFFALTPEKCANNKYDISDNKFLLTAPNARVGGVFPAGAKLAIADPTKWASPADFLGSAGAAGDAQSLVGSVKIENGHPQYVALQRLVENQAQSSIQDAAGAYDEADKYEAAIRTRVKIDTPDPYINSAMPAICIAADGVWDGAQHIFMHGAVAWRNRYLGWRGLYNGDALGWHDRLPQHIASFAVKQNVTPVSDEKLSADGPDLSRSEKMLHSNGDMANSHYDMNMVAIDGLLRHFLWTGDLEYAKSIWPVMKRHIEWEHRMFRREFGPEKLPLYEAYAAIWASDDMWYSGGGVAHSTAYNYYAHRMYARIAKAIGEDPTPYDHEADLIATAMEKLLWLPREGWYAESKDLLGLQLVHPNAGVWTHYHTIDSLVPDKFHAWEMGQFVDSQIPHIPVQGPNVPAGYFQLSTTSWMPYAWSTNNVVMAETVHTSLADFQAGRIDRGFATLKGALLDSMYLGQCPGNVGMCTAYDDYRRESQRDFDDAVGISSRALIEGLFGLLPDALAGKLTIRPGFPRDWDHASIVHPDVSSSFKREGMVETFIVESRFPKPMQLCIEWPALAVEVASVTVNGQPAKWENIGDSVDLPHIRITAEAASKWDVKITWRGEAPAKMKNPAFVVTDESIQASAGNAKIVDVADPQQTLSQVKKSTNQIDAQASGLLGARTAFAKVQQGQFEWWLPINFEIRPASELVQSPTTADGKTRFKILSNTGGKETASDEVTADAIALPGSTMFTAGSAAGPKTSGELVNWKVNAPANTKFETIDLSSLFNDRVTQIFQNEYRSPRSPFTSLSIPLHGLGGWASGAARVQIDDSGLRDIAGKNGGKFMMPQGIPFATPGPGDSKNIAFASQWDNFPREVVVPLSGPSSHVYLMMAGSTNNMASRFDNGELIVTYADGSTQRLALNNPVNWWPIEKDYFVDDYAFARPEPVPPRVDLRTGKVRVADPSEIKGGQENIAGGAATVLDLQLDHSKQLKSLTVRALANEVVIGVMSVTLVR